MEKETTAGVSPSKPTPIERSGERLILPEGMSYAAAMDLLKRRNAFELETTNVVRDFSVHPYDSAHALTKVLEKRFGWADAERPSSVDTVDVESGFGQTTKVAWGGFSLPNTSGGKIQTGFTKKDGRYIGRLIAECKRMDEDFVRGIFDDVANYLKTGSLYAGKCMSIRFLDEDGGVIELVSPTFMDTNVDEGMLTFNEDVD